jgi:hypothetical protein
MVQLSKSFLLVTHPGQRITMIEKSLLGMVCTTKTWLGQSQSWLSFQKHAHPLM